MSVDITIPVIKILYIKKKDKQVEKIPITVQYERLPDFCYCCGCFGHQYKKCAVYRNQAKEDLLYGSWVQAQTTAEKWKQSRVRGKWNITLEDSNNGS